MATATSKPRKPKPQPTAIRLMVAIGDTAYAVRPLTADPDAGISALVRFRRLDTGAVHHVAETEHGATCDCGDQVWRHEGRDEQGCRHIRAARAAGLLDRPHAAPAGDWTTGADDQQRARQDAFRAAATEAWRAATFAAEFA